MSAASQQCALCYATATRIVAAHDGPRLVAAHRACAVHEAEVVAAVEGRGRTATVSVIYGIVENGAPSGRRAA